MYLTIKTKGTICINSLVVTVTLITNILYSYNNIIIICFGIAPDPYLLWHFSLY